MKKRFTILFILAAMTVSVFAQNGGDQNVKDKHKMRQAMYDSKQEAFPPPKKNQWSIGAQVGYSGISGDVVMRQGYGLGLNARFALGHLVSLRGQLSMGTTNGLNWRPNGGFSKNPALNGTNNEAANYWSDATYPFVFYNYQMQFKDANVQAVVSILNFNFHNREPKVGMYFFGGVGMMMYNTKVDALDANGQMYDYSGIVATQDLSLKKDVYSALNNMLDKEYETAAQNHPNYASLGDNTVLPAGHFGLGISYKLNNRIDLSLEHRATWTGDDLLDGQTWEETFTLTSNSDILQMTTVGINIRLGKGEESYWWQNPMSNIYSDVRDIKREAGKDDKDSDKDGVPDSRDKEPGTPEGVMVDALGRAIDSDGDGLQDFRDKEPFTPKGARVDSDGVALDTDDDGVIDFFDKEPNSASGVQADANGVTIAGSKGNTEVVTDYHFPIVNFDLGKYEVDRKFYPGLYQLAEWMKMNPDKNIRVVGHTDSKGSADFNKELSKKRANAVVYILTEEFKVDKSRLAVDFKGFDELAVNNMSGLSQDKNDALNYLNRRVVFEIAD